MPIHDHYVIIGNGPAGNQAARCLRENDADAKITIISDENVPYYYKPKLVRYLSGSLDDTSLLVENADAYRDRKIRLRLGQTVERIDPVGRQVFLSHMETVSYTALIIASGSKARILPSMMPFADCLKFVTSYNDVLDVREAVADAKEVFIFGGDLVGFKFLNMLTGMGKNVTLLIYPNAFWPFNLSDEMLDTIVAKVEKSGAAVLVKDDIKTIETVQEKYVVKTTRGIEKEVDLVFSFNGLIPNVGFAKGCGLDIDRGILVSETMQTNLDGIWACGSCAQIYNPNINSYTTSIGWPNAIVQGEVAAMNLLGDTRVVRNAGRKYFDLEGVKIKTTWWEEIEEDNA